MKLAIAGYFGGGNFGDEAVLSGLLRGLEGQGIEPLVLSDSPEQTAKRFQVRSEPRRDFQTIKRVLPECDALALGGGSLLQDVTSFKSLLYYLYLVYLGKKLTGKVVLTGQGIGPLRRKASQSLTRIALNRANLIAVRDADSMRLLQRIGVKTPVRQTADLAWLMPPDEIAAHKRLSALNLPSQKPLIALAPRPWHSHTTEQMAFLWASLIDEIAGSGAQAIGFAMDQEVDAPLWEAIGKRTDNAVILDRFESPEEILGLMGRMSGCVAMRLHAALFAASAGIAPFCLSYDPKVDALRRLLQLPESVSLEGLTKEILLPAWNEFQAKQLELQIAVKRVREDQQKLARINIELILSVLRAQA